MNILLIGQCSLHWGRMEFGNIGNYYIIEPLVREIHRTFPGAIIRTTMQMSDDFCRAERVERLPLEVYYGWRDSEKDLAQKEVEISEEYKLTGLIRESTPYIEQVMWSDVVIDFSGDIWGDNANFLGPDRFLVGLYKDLVAQNFGKPTVMIAGSPGPFGDEDVKQLAKKVYAGFRFVSNREHISTILLREEGFDISRTQSHACPAFLFDVGEAKTKVQDIYRHEKLEDIRKSGVIVGFILCGWNFERGPFDLWPRQDIDYKKFADVVESFILENDVQVCLMSHANGFLPPPAEFKLMHGRDYPIAKQLKGILDGRGLSQRVHLIEGVYSAKETKAIIGSFDMLVSGRVHAAVAGISQNIPTVIIDYGHEPKAHKLLGFASVVGVERFVVDPSSVDDMKSKIFKCWDERVSYRSYLASAVPRVQDTVRDAFAEMKQTLV